MRRYLYIPKFSLLVFLYKKYRMIHSSSDQWQPSGHIWAGRTARVSPCYLFNGMFLGTLHWLGPEGAPQCCSVIAVKRPTALMKFIIIRAEVAKLPKLQSVHVMTKESVRSSADTQSKRPNCGTTPLGPIQKRYSCGWLEEKTSSEGVIQIKQFLIFVSLENIQHNSILMYLLWLFIYGLNSSHKLKKSHSCQSKRVYDPFCRKPIYRLIYSI